MYQAMFAKAALKGYSAALPLSPRRGPSPNVCGGGWRWEEGWAHFDEKKSDEPLYLSIVENEPKRSRSRDSDEDSRKRLRIT